MKPLHASRRERGSAIAALLVSVLICGALSAAVIVTNTSRSQEALAEMHAERAFQLAEAGADWAVVQLRIRRGTVPTTGTTTVVPGSGEFQIRYTQGDENNLDDDGDGVVDNSGEEGFAAIYSTGTSGPISRTVEVMMRKAIEIPGFDGSMQLNVEEPILDLKGNAFIIDGNEHFIDGTLDPSRPAKYGIASPAETDDVTAQIDSGQVDQVIGFGGTPSVGKTAAIDMNMLVNQARASATTYVESGTHSNLNLGTPTEAGVITAYCNGDLHLSGNSGGAGILAVDGNMIISGSFEWTGIVLVRGRVDLVGGGGEKRVIGAMGVGEEVNATTSTQFVGVTGTVDVLYSSDAVALASEALAIMAVMSWREVGNPTP